MLPTIEEAEKELKLAGELNPGPWVKHSINVGIAARNITHKLPNLDENKAYIFGLLHDIGRRVGIVNIPKHVYEGYKYSLEKGWDITFKNKEYFEEIMECSIYDVLPDIGRTTLLCSPPWKPHVKRE